MFCCFSLCFLNYKKPLISNIINNTNTLWSSYKNDKQNNDTVSEKLVNTVESLAAEVPDMFRSYRLKTQLADSGIKYEMNYIVALWLLDV